jgi:hypothetical protein
MLANGDPPAIRSEVSVQSGPMEFSGSQRRGRTNEGTPGSRRLRVSFIPCAVRREGDPLRGSEGGSERQCADGCEIHQAVRLLGRRRSRDDS